ncbi:MAG: SAM-dependent methyltransferase [Acidobacteria bacterium]|nr:SAM-dependent methyltransferase [Acidobacteriota bacterium]
MSTHSHALDEALSEFVRNVSMAGESPLLARLREETSHLEMARMQISVEQGRLMAVLAGAIGARRAVEVGVFTGYSSLTVAHALPPDGKLVALDVSDEWTSVARRYWAEAGVADKIDLRLAPAGESLAAMLAAGEAGTYDFAFIDADKDAYPGYYAQCLELLRPGGLVLIDNMFLHGRVLEPAPDDRAAHIVRDLAHQIFADARVVPSLVPIGDGLLLARKL